MNYSHFKVGETVVIVNNPDVPDQNGTRGVVLEIHSDHLDLDHEEEGEVSYRQTIFRKLNKLEKALK